MNVGFCKAEVFEAFCFEVAVDVVGDEGEAHSGSFCKLFEAAVAVFLVEDFEEAHLFFCEKFVVFKAKNREHKGFVICYIECFESVHE